MSSSNSLTKWSATESKAISLLGTGVPAETVASTIGVTPSYISQLLSNPEFTAEVAELRFSALQKHNARDSKADTIEDKLLDKLEDLLPLMVRPMEVIKAYQTINGAKRRGASAPDHITNTQNIVSIQMPTVIVNKFTTNIQNQVIRAGSQNLETMQSGSLLKEIKESQERNANDEQPQRTLSAPRDY